MTAKLLFGEEDIDVHSVRRITDKMRAGVQKGFYRKTLQEAAGVESCQVNSLEYTFCETEYPDLLFQDLSIIPFSSRLDVDRIRRETGLPVRTLKECYQAIDWYFERYGRQAVAVKDQSAYERRLDYGDVPVQVVTPLFEHYVHDPARLTGSELKAVQDHLWRYCIWRATEYNLPIKLHTGYHAGTGRMPLAQVSMNLKDLCPILKDFPNTRFVLMHMSYPYQDELLALAKHCDNVYADLSWSWLINPMATMRFVKEFLTTVPWMKLLSFGGDYYCAENIVGHADIARRGLVQALSELVEEKWLTEETACSLVNPLMYYNAWDAFRMGEKLRVAQAILNKQQVQVSC